MSSTPSKQTTPLRLQVVLLLSSTVWCLNLSSVWGFAFVPSKSSYRPLQHQQAQHQHQQKKLLSSCPASLCTLAAAVKAPDGQEETQNTSDDGGAKNTDSDGDNKAMKFLKKIGRVGRRQDFTHALGVDEGSVGKSSMNSGGLRKARAAYPIIGPVGADTSATTTTHLIDDLTEPFPLTSLGTSWSGYTDQVMGGKSTGVLERQEDFYGRTANVLRGTVRLLPGEPTEGKAGFVQMATNLVLESASIDGSGQTPTANALGFDGVELDVLYDGDEPTETFNVHLKTTACLVPNASYRASFELSQPREWQTIRVPWSAFVGFGAGAAETPLDPSKLLRTGIVAIGKPMPSLVLGVSRFQFFSNKDIP